VASIVAQITNARTAGDCLLTGIMYLSRVTPHNEPHECSLDPNSSTWRHIVLGIAGPGLFRALPCQQALASVDAFPQQPFKALVGYINLGISAQSGVVEIKLGVLEPAQNLKQDMTVSVDFAAGR